MSVLEPEAVVVKRVKQGYFSAVLENQIRLSYSFYGPTGEYKGVAHNVQVESVFMQVFVLDKVVTRLNIRVEFFIISTLPQFM